jgi:hypothetical protein
MTFNKNVQADQYFFIERPKLAMDLSYEHQTDERSGPFANRKDVTETYIEKLQIVTRGFAYHPAFLVYDLELIPEWEQLSENKSDGSTRSSNTFLGGYYFNTEIFQYKPYTVKLYGSRQRTTIKGNFASTSKNNTDTYGADLILKYDILPITFNYEHKDSRQTGFFKTEIKDDTYGINIFHNRYFGTSVLHASFQKSERNTLVELIDRNQYKVDFSNLYKYKDASLNSNLLYSEADDSHSLNKTYQIYENLTWIHRNNLRTSYYIRYVKNNLFDKDNLRPTRTENKAVGFKLNHMLYENLSTAISIEGRENSARVSREGQQLRRKCAI